MEEVTRDEPVRPMPKCRRRARICAGIITTESRMIRHNGLNRFTIWLALSNSKNASHRMSSRKLYAMTIKDLVHGRLAALVNSMVAVRM